MSFHIVYAHSEDKYNLCQPCYLLPYPPLPYEPIFMDLLYALLI